MKEFFVCVVASEKKIKNKGFKTPAVGIIAHFDGFRNFCGLAT